MENQLSLPHMPTCDVCAREYGRWIGQHMKVRWNAQRLLKQGEHPYDHEESDDSKNASER